MKQLSFEVAIAEKEAEDEAKMLGKKFRSRKKQAFQQVKSGMGGVRAAGTSELFRGAPRDEV